MLAAVMMIATNKFSADSSLGIITIIINMMIIIVIIVMLNCIWRKRGTSS